MNKATKDARLRYKLDADRCQVPNCQYAATDTHEICRGVHRAKAVLERCTWLALCRGHHSDMGDYELWPLERQLALKALVDPAWFDLAKINELRGRAPGAIELADVIKHLRMR